MDGTQGARRKSTQDRALATRARITNGAIEVLARSGVAGLTHRAVARAAGVNLAATTYHFATKLDIIADASRSLLDGYLVAFTRLEERIASGQEERLWSIDDLVNRVVANALGRESTRSLAWCEIILHGGRSTASRALTRDWYAKLDAIWFAIAQRIAQDHAPRRASAAIDLTVGLSFLLHPLHLDPDAVHDLLSGRVDIENLVFDPSSGELPAAANIASDAKQRRQTETRENILAAAIDILIEEGTVGVSYRSVAERAGMVRSGPSYYFPTIDDLLQAAQMALFMRAKERYRAGLGAMPSAAINEQRLLDVTTAIYFREALEFAQENVGYYSAWLSATQNPLLRPAVTAALLDQHRAWSRRIASISGRKANPAIPLRLQAMFVGKLVRATCADTSVADLSMVREDFAAVLRAHGTAHL